MAVLRRPSSIRNAVFHSIISSKSIGVYKKVRLYANEQQLIFRERSSLLFSLYLPSSPGMLPSVRKRHKENYV